MQGVYPQKGLIKMNDEKPIYTVLLDREVIDETNYKKKDLMCILAILLEYYKQQSVYGVHITEIPCNVACLWANMVWSVKPSRRDRENFIESINRIVSTGLIEVVEKSGEASAIRWNTNMIIDVKNLIHDVKKTFIKFNSQNLEKLIEFNYKTLTTLLQIYISITSYFNEKQIDYFDNCIEKGIAPIDVNYDLYGTLDYHISCWASQDRLTRTKHNMDTPGNQWITKPTLIEGLKLLEQAGLIAIVKPNAPKNENFANHYCYPRHKKYVQMIADMQVKQIIHERGN